VATIDPFVTRVVREGAAQGPLVGCSFAIKDLFDLSGIPTGGGNPEWHADQPPAGRTAPAVEQLLTAGATCLGKVITSEFAYSLTGINPHYGTPVNPKAPDRIPGGSSCGSAAVVASGEVDFALGTDTGGSVRVPASYCGILGIRPTHGAISVEGLMPLVHSFDTVGWFTQRADLLCAVGQVLLPQSKKECSTRLIMATDLFGWMDRPSAEALKAVLPSVTAQFDSVEEALVCEEGMEHWLWTYTCVQGFEAWQQYGAWLERHQPALEPGIARAFELAKQVTVTDYRKACHQKAAIASRLAALIGEAIVCLPPALSIAPLRSAAFAELAECRQRQLSLVAVASLGGFPQISLPLASYQNCPLGLSLLAGRGGDSHLLALAEQILGAKSDPFVG
jgi:amidase